MLACTAYRLTHLCIHACLETHTTLSAFHSLALSLSLFLCHVLTLTLSCALSLSLLYALFCPLSHSYVRTHAHPLLSTLSLSNAHTVSIAQKKKKERKHTACIHESQRSWRHHCQLGSACTLADVVYHQKLFHCLSLGARACVFVCACVSPMDTIASRVAGSQRLTRLPSG